jgi:hypothetical protein
MAGKFKKQLAILLGFVIITLVPNFLNLQGTTYSIRTVILFPILGIMSAVGIYSLRNRLLRIITALIYLIFVLNFCYIYFNRLPVEKAEGWFLSQRVLSKYISEAISVNAGNKIILVTKEPKLAFYRYLLYSGKYTDPKEINLLNSKIAREDYEIGNLKITDMCLKDVTIMSTTSDCPKIKGDTIKSIYDAGDMYVLSNDVLCKGYTKNQYPLIKGVKTLVVEKLSTEDFCKNFISI